MWKMILKNADSEDTWQDQVEVIKVVKGQRTIGFLEENATYEMAKRQAEITLSYYNASLPEDISPIELVDLIKI